MRRSVKTAAVAIVMGMALAAPVYAMTGGELKAVHTSEYTSGTESVYGPVLTQAQLDMVAQTVWADGCRTASIGYTSIFL